MDSMDEQLFAIIEHERDLDDWAEGLTEQDLTPTAIIADGEGGTLEVYADGSSCVKMFGEIA